MASIYLTADSVVVWLGEESKLKDGEFAFAVGKNLRALHASPAYSSAKVTEMILRLWRVRANSTTLSQKFVNRRYFNRLWIVQELFHAASIEVVLGPHRTGFPELLRALDGLSKDNETRSQRRYYHQMNAIHELQQRGDSGLHNAVESLCKFQRLQCHDPRDRLFALASLWNTGFLHIDYSISCEQVYTKFAVGLARASHSFDGSGGNIEISQLLAVVCEQAGERHSLGANGHPSWVPDWRLDSPERNLGKRHLDRSELESLAVQWSNTWLRFKYPDVSQAELEDIIGIGMHHARLCPGERLELRGRIYGKILAVQPGFLYFLPSSTNFGPLRLEFPSAQSWKEVQRFWQTPMVDDMLCVPAESNHHSTIILRPVNDLTQEGRSCFRVAGKCHLRSWPAFDSVKYWEDYLSFPEEDILIV